MRASVTALLAGTLGFGVSVGDEVYGLTDWYRDDAAAELVTGKRAILFFTRESVVHA